MSDRKMPVRERVVKLTGEWEGWEFTARINPPLRALSDLASGSFARFINGLGDIVLGWNFVDEKGEPILPVDEKGKPTPPGEGGNYPVDALPVDLYREMSDRFFEELRALPPA